MKVINREMTVKENSERDFLDCQASFNSHGYITLRNYTVPNKNEDQIIILSAEETQAIIQLFSRLGRMLRNNTLPF